MKLKNSSEKVETEDSSGSSGSERSRSGADRGSQLCGRFPRGSTWVGEG